MVCRPPARKAGMRVTRKQRIRHPPAKQVRILRRDGKGGALCEQDGAAAFCGSPASVYNAKDRFASSKQKFIIFGRKTWNLILI